MGKWGNSLQWTGRQLQYNWTIPLAAAGAAATKFALDQEAAMTRVAKVYGDASMPIEQQRSEVAALGKAFTALSNIYGVTAAETADIGAQWAAAGLSGLALAKNTELTMKTMVIGEMSATEATEALIAIQAQYGQDAAGLADTMARLNAIENATGASTQGLVQAFARTAGVARSAGVSVVELGGMIAALTPAAGSAAQAGNALKTIIGRLMSPTQPATQILNEMGIATKDVAWQSMSATQRLQELARVFPNLTDAQKQVASATLAGLHQTNKFEIALASIASESGYYAKALEVAGDNADYFGVAQRELNAVLESNPQKVKQAGVILQNSMVKVIQPLLPLIVGTAQEFAIFADKISQMNPEVLKLTVFGLAMLAMLGLVARYVGSVATLISVLGSAFTALRVPVLLNALTFGIFRKKAVTEVAAAAVETTAIQVPWMARMRAIALAGLMGVGRVFGWARFTIRATWALTMWALNPIMVTATAAMRTTWTIFSVAISGITAELGTLLPRIWAQIMWMVEAVLVAGARAAGIAYRAAMITMSVITAEIGMSMAAIWRTLQATMVAIQVAGMALLRGAAAVGYAAFEGILRIVAAGAGAIWRALQIGLAAIQVAGMRALQTIIAVGGTALNATWRAVQFGMVAVSKGAWALMVAVTRISLTRSIQIVVAAGRLLFTAMTGPWGIAIAAVIGLLILFRDQIKVIYNRFVGYFHDANNNVVKAFDALPNGVRGAFLKVVAIVKAAVLKVYELFSYMNPFAHHSPSLVENVTNGLAAVRAQFGTLTQVRAPIMSAYAAIKNLKDVSASLREGEISIKLAQQIADLAEVAPQVIPAFRALNVQLSILQQKADALDSAINAQQNTIDIWKASLDAASDALDKQQDKLSDLQKVADDYENSIITLKNAISDLASTPISGIGAMEDQIFANEQAQKRLRLEIMRMEDAGQSYEDVKQKIADLNGEIEGLRGTQNDMRAMGAGSEILGFYDQQIAALEDQKKAMGAQSAPIAKATKELEALQRQAEEMDLTKSLKFDPLQRQIEKASSTMQEMPFDQIMSGIAGNKAALGPLETAWQQATDAVTRQQAAVDQAQAAHDEIQAGYDSEVQKLDALKDAYSEVSDAIGDVNTALSDMKSAVDAAKADKESVSPALQNFRDAAIGEDFPVAGSDAILGREGDLGDQSAAIDKYTSDLEKTLGESFGGLDMFGPIKDMWNKFTGWWGSTVQPWINSLGLGQMFSMIFEDVDWSAPFDDMAGSIDWDSLVTKMADTLSTAISTVLDVGKYIVQWLGPDFMETIGIIWTKLQDWWNKIVDIFAGEGGSGGVLDSFVDAFTGLWNFLAPILEVIWKGMVLWIHVIWSAINGALGPILDMFIGIFAGIWKVIKGFFDIVAGIFTGDWKRVWDGFVGILAGLGGIIWSILKGVFLSIIGWIGGFATGIWDVATYLWDGFLGALKSGWDAIWNWITDAFQSVIDWVKDLFGIRSPSTVFAEIGSNLIQGMLDGAKKIWTNIETFFTQMLPTALTKIGDVSRGLWNKGLDIVGGFLGGIVQKAIDLWQWWVDVRTTAYAKIGDVAKTLWDKGIGIVGGFFGGIGEKAKELFQWFVDLPGNLARKMGNVGSTLWQIGVDILNSFGNGINAAWETIKTKAREPIQWVVDVVWNNGLRSLWNTMNNLWGGNDLDKFYFAKGGVMPGYTPGRDVHKFFSPTGGMLALSGGEAILRPEATRAIGGKPAVDAINAAARSGGVDAVVDLLRPQNKDAYYAKGGVLEIPGWISTGLKLIPGMSGVADAIDQINKSAGPGDGEMGAGVGFGLLKTMGDKTWDAIKQVWKNDSPGSGNATPSNGNNQVNRMFATIQRAFPRAKLNAGYENRPGYHGRGKAVDLGEAGFSGGNGRQYLADMAAWIYGNVKSIAELIYNGAYARVSNVKNGANHAYDAATRAVHNNHVHWAMENWGSDPGRSGGAGRVGIMDTGGMLRSGDKAVNLSGSNERVLSPRQTAAFERLVNLLDSTRLPSPEALEGAIFKATVKARRAESIGGQTTVNGDYGTTNITLNFYGDLEFPNITDGDSAETFMQNLSDIAGGVR